MTEPYTDQAIPIEYVAGLFDGAGSISLRISESNKTDIGFEIIPSVWVSINNEMVLGLLDEFGTDHGLFPKIEQTGHGTTRWTLRSRRDVEQFLSTIEPHLVNHYERAGLMLYEVLPRLEKERHLTKRGFVEVAELADELDKHRLHGKERKYTADYFRERWEKELTGTSQ